MRGFSRFIPFGDVRHTGSFSDFGQKFIGHVALDLGPLVAEKEFDEIPASALFTSGEGGSSGWS